MLERRCDECGFDAGVVDRHDIPRAFRENAQVWLALLADPAAASAPGPTGGRRWSTPATCTTCTRSSTTGCRRCSPRTPRTSPTGTRTPRPSRAGYASQLPSIVGPTLVAAAYAVGDLYASVPPLSWHRRGVRSDGSEFTVETSAATTSTTSSTTSTTCGTRRGAATVAGLRRLRRGVRRAAPTSCPPVRAAVAGSAALLPPGARVLEIGSGAGRDAGPSSRPACPSGVPTSRPASSSCSSGRPRRRRGRPAHRRPRRPGRARHAVRRGLGERLPAARRARRPADGARRLAEVTEPGGLLYVALKEGDGEGWSVHGNVSAPRLLHLLARGAPPVGADRRRLAGDERRARRGFAWRGLAPRRGAPCMSRGG